MIVSVIAAVAENQVIGADNSLIWHLPEDLKNFKRLTMGKFLIMGRKTWESIGKPLPGRTNIVITSSRQYEVEGCLVFNSLQMALHYADQQGQDEVFIIGGGEIYRQALPVADKLYLTSIKAAFAGDTFFPEINSEEWEVVSERYVPADERHSYPFDILELVRREK